jgi:hypothetical protein
VFALSWPRHSVSVEEASVVAAGALAASLLAVASPVVWRGRDGSDLLHQCTRAAKVWKVFPALCVLLLSRSPTYVWPQTASWNLRSPKRTVSRASQSPRPRDRNPEARAREQPGAARFRFHVWKISFLLLC